MLGKMPWKPDQRFGEMDDVRDFGIRGIESQFPHSLPQLSQLIPPLQRAREPRGLLGVEPEHLPQITQCAARTILNHRGGDRRPRTPILDVNVLNDFLTTLV